MSQVSRAVPGDGTGGTAEPEGRKGPGEESFEQALGRLEDIVRRLESGDLGLDESLALFEEGIRLSRFCSRQLDEAERKIEVLLKDAGGDFVCDEEGRPLLSAEPFAYEAGEDQ